MHRYIGTASLFGAIGIASAATHELIVGTFGTPFLYTINFNDETLTLEQTANTSVPIASSWLSLNVSHKTNENHAAHVTYMVGQNERKKKGGGVPSANNIPPLLHIA